MEGQNSAILDCGWFCGQFEEDELKNA